MSNSYLPHGLHPALAGKPLFPVNKNKRPAVKEWRHLADRMPTPEEMSSWRGHSGPWAMPTGPLSYVAIDFDGEEGRKLFEAKYSNGTGLPICALTPSGGYHGLYAYPKDAATAKLLKNAVRVLPGVDIRAHGGYIVIPSAFQDGRAWLQPPDIEPWPLPEWVIDALRKQSLPASPQDQEISLDGFPPGVPEGQRNATAARVIGRYIARGLTAEETFRLAVEWNRKNSPPLEESTLREMSFRIYRKEREKAPEIELVSFQDLAERTKEPGKMAISPFLPPGGKCILAGTGGVGKTLLAMNVAGTVKNDLLAFGRFNASPGRVLYVDAESTEALSYNRLQRICTGLNVPTGGIDFIFPVKKLDLGSDRGRSALCKKIEECRASYLILDSFLCFANIRSENDNVEVRNYLEGLSEITRQTGVTLILLDHAAKPSAERTKAGISLTARGAGAKRDWCDALLTFEERKNDTKFLRILRFDKTRFCAPIPALTLEMDSHFVFRPLDEEGICPVFSIRQAVDDNPGIGAAKLYEALSASVGCSKRTAMRAVADAVSLGHIRREEKTRFVTFYPPKVTNGDVTLDENPGADEEKPVVYQ